jgi:hypothetical protein
MLPNRLKSACVWCLALLVCVLFLNSGLPVWAQDTPHRAPQAEDDQFWDDRFGFVGIEGQVMAAAVAANGDLYVGGSFRKAGGAEAQNIARWDGRTWHPLGAGVDGYVRSIAFVGDDVYVAGSFVMAGSVTVGQLARWNGQNWSRVGGGGGPVDAASGFPETGAINTLLAADGGLYVGGNFTSMDGAPGNNIIFWNGQSWSALGGGVGRLDFEGNFVADGDVRALAHDGDHLYVAGVFEQTGDGAANAIASWDGVTWSPLGAGLTYASDGSGFDRAQVMALALHKGKLYAGGVFNRADGKPATRFAAWNGAAWSEAGEGVAVKQFSSDNGINALVSSGDYLYVGGNFIAAGGQPLSLVARWDGAAWSGLGAGIHNEGYDSVLSLAATADGGVYIGGSYLFAADLRVDNIAFWNGADWRALGGGLIKSDYGDTPAVTYALTQDEAGRVYAGGDFRVAGGVKVENLALWDGEAWRNIGGVNDSVRALAVAGDHLYIGGDFTQAGGIAANHVARWNRITGEWSALGNGVNGVVNALTFANGRLFVGGNFSAAGAASAYDLAIWDGAAWQPFGDKARIYERSQEGGEVGTQVNALAVAGDVVYVAGHFQTIQYGLDTSDSAALSSSII